jgi:uncharacterized protein YegJ (DUF2314 family)
LRRRRDACATNWWLTVATIRKDSMPARIMSATPTRMGVTYHGGVTANQSNPWHIPEPPPTTLIVAWPGDEAPRRDDVIVRFSDAAADVIGHAEVAAPDERIRWASVIHVPSIHREIIVWAEAGRPIPDFAARGEKIAPSRWVVGLETLLDAAQPVEAWTALMRLVAKAIPGAPHVIDVNSTRIHARPAIDDLVAMPDVPASGRDLWAVHAVTGASNESCWLHTHGLDRVGRPDLEMLDVPRDLGIPGIELIEVIGERLLEEPCPPPGERMIVGGDPAGREWAAALQPWRVAAEFVADATPGSLRDRAADDREHAGVRAAVCAAEPKGAFRKVWTPPLDILRAMAEGDVLFNIADGAAERARRLAWATWPDLAMAHADLLRASGGRAPADIHFAIKAAFDDGEAGQRGAEHMWLDVIRFDGDRAHARLVNRPMHLKSVREGGMVWIDRSRLSDWVVVSPHGRFTPSQRSVMRQAIASRAK